MNNLRSMDVSVPLVIYSNRLSGGSDNIDVMIRGVFKTFRDIRLT